MVPKMIKMIIFKSTPVIANDYEGIDDDGIDARIYMTYMIYMYDMMYDKIMIITFERTLPAALCSSRFCSVVFAVSAASWKHCP